MVYFQLTRTHELRMAALPNTFVLLLCPKVWRARYMPSYLLTESPKTNGMSGRTRRSYACMERHIYLYDSCFEALVICPLLWEFSSLYSVDVTVSRQYQ